MSLEDFSIGWLSKVKKGYIVPWKLYWCRDNTFWIDPDVMLYSDKAGTVKLWIEETSEGVYFDAAQIEEIRFYMPVSKRFVEILDLIQCYPIGKNNG